MKTCTKCLKNEFQVTFRKNKLRKDGLQIWCKECTDKYRKDNRESINANKRKHYRKNIREIKSSHYKWKFGISVKEYDKLFELQGGRCAICHRHQSEFSRKLAIDHNHKTTNVRGLLCIRCNTGLGLFDDNSELLLLAAAYLKSEIQMPNLSHISKEN